MCVRVASALLVVSVLAAPVHGANEVAPKAKSLSQSEVRERRVHIQLRQLTAELGLTQEQQLQVKPLLETRMSEVRALRMDQDLDPQEKESRLAAIQETFRTQLQGALTPEQVQKFAAIRENRRLAAQQTQTQKRKGRVPVDDEPQ